MSRNKNRAFATSKTFNIVNPIARSTRDGVFRLSTTSIEKYKSNLYTLVFTGVGERAMEPEFGTILKYLLFEQITEDTYNTIEREIYDKTALWIPEIEITSVDFGNTDEDKENNRINIKINFRLVVDSTIQDFIEIEVGV